MHVTSAGVIQLQKDTKSEYGHLYLAGTKIVKGHYLNYEKRTREGMLYKKSKDEAIVPQECILYYGIGLKLKQTDIYVFEKEDHEDIMCTLAL